MKHIKVLGLTVLLAACANRSMPDVTTTDPDASLPVTTDHTVEGHEGHSIRDLASPGPEAPQGESLRPLPNLNGPPVTQRLQPLSHAPNTNVVALRVLVLTGASGDLGPNTQDVDLSAARAMLDQAGVPYDVMNPALTTFNADTLVAADGTGRYQGIILTTSNLAYESAPGVWTSALDWTGWSLLHQYEKDYHTRQLSLYTYPSTWPEDYGLRDAGLASSNADVRPTAAAANILTDLKQVYIPVRLAWNYPATLTTVPGVTNTPLLKDGSGRVYGVQSNVDGRERLALTMSHNAVQLHSKLLGHSLVNWLTRGVRIGEYRRFAQLDIDDWFLPGDVYNPSTGAIKPDAFRISSVDAMNVPVQLDNLRKTYPVAKTLNLSMAYNGGGANPAAPLSCATNPAGTPDKLSSATKCLAKSFDWVSHTRDHEYMDFMNYDNSFFQLNDNLSIGRAFDLALSDKGLVTGDMSGLGFYNPNGEGQKFNYGLEKSNPYFLGAAYDTGVKFLASNRSVEGQWDPNCTNCGLYHPLNTQVNTKIDYAQYPAMKQYPDLDIFLIPRWPTNVYYHVTNPTQAISAYNAVYGPTGTQPYYDHNLTYSEYLDKESDIALSHLLSGSAFPHYMHQNNLRQYSSNKSLMSDWLNALLRKYSRYTTLPLNTLTWNDLGPYMLTRTKALKAGVSGTWNRATNTVSVTSASGGPAFVTGVIGDSANTTSYGGRNISLVTLGAGESVTLPVQ